MSTDVALQMARLARAVYLRPWVQAESAAHQAGWKPVAVVDHGEAQAMLAEQPGAGVAIALRGTEFSRWRWRDLRTNLGVAHPWAGVGQAHSGYDVALARIRDRIADDLCPLIDTSRPVRITGHSQGGALAHVLAAWPRLGRIADQLAEVVTFGAPRALDAAAGDTIPSDVYRHVVSGDLAPSWPPLGDLEHPAPPVRLRSPVWSPLPMARHSIDTYIRALGG